jgi:signal transduction histidine kinase
MPSLPERRLTNKFDCLAGGGEMGALMRSMDWSKTPVGPVDSWSPALRMMVRLLLANRFPLLLWWGPWYCQFYNDPYRPVLGAKHPRSMGQPASECLPEIWHIICPLIDSPFRGGPATWMEDILLEYQRHDFLEEAHFTIAYSPVPDDSVPSGIGGVLATVQEITEKVVGDRRVAVLRDLGACSADANTAEEACVIAAQALRRHPRDIPFALLYLIDSNHGAAYLAATCGIEKSSPDAPLVVHLRGDASNSVWPIHEVVKSDQMLVVDDLATRLKAVPRGPWSEPPQSAALMPIRSSIAHQLAGVLIAGISPRLWFDQSYQSFLALIRTQVSTAIANARAYEEERKRAEALAEIDRAKTAFFSNVSHEFRTPLTLMLGPLEDILATSAGRLTNEQREQLTVVHRNSLRLLKLVNSLLDFSRIEAGRVEAVYQPTDISVLTAELASIFRSAMQCAGLVYEIACEPLSEPVFVDREMWEKIVLNLISNAFKFTFEGKISVTVKSVADSVQLQVSDTGTGIPDRALPHLFERFYRVEGARRRTYEGTGIGLALVQELVKLHGGTIDVQSGESKGTTFTVSIPEGSGHLPQDRIGAVRTSTSSPIHTDSYVEEALGWLPPEFKRDQAPLKDTVPDSAVAVPGVPSERPELATVRSLIVVADDNFDMRDYIRRLLAQHYRIHGVSNGVDAVKAARELNADLILADVMMPQLDGFGVLRALRSDPATRLKPVILLSARAGEESRIEGLQAGADDYLVKPFTARELLARVGAHLRMARARTESAEIERHLRAEADLERNRLRESFTQAPAAMALLNGPNHEFAFVNEAYVEMVARDITQLIGKTAREVFPEIGGQGYFELLDRVYQSGEPFLATARAVTLNRHGKQESIYLDFGFFPVRNLVGEVDGILFQGVDVTEQVMARSQLEARVKERTAELEQAHEGLRELNHRLMRAQDEERRRLGLELHDSAGQLLVALKWKLGPLHKEIGPDHAEWAKLATDAFRLADELSQELRTVSHLLHPPLLEQAGLSSALRLYVEGLAERSGLKVQLEIDPDLQRMKPETEAIVFRIVQESLTNVHRHARTKTAKVQISQSPHTVRIQIEDNGGGIPGFTTLEETNFKLGVGIQGMRERVRQLNGSFEIASSPNGTTVTAVIPTNVAEDEV